MSGHEQLLDELRPRRWRSPTACWGGSRIPGVSIRPAEVNGAPGVLLRDADDRLAGVWALDIREGPLDIREGQIHGVGSIVNPDKLAHLGPVADIAALIRQVARH